MIAVIVGLVGFALGDYARIQVNKARNYFQLVSLTRDRANLLHANNELQAKLYTLSSTANRNDSIEQGLKARLDELASIVKSLKGIDPALDAPFVSSGSASKVITSAADVISGPLSLRGAKARFSEAGIGGAEIECEGNPRGCVSMGLRDSNLKLERLRFDDIGSYKDSGLLEDQSASDSSQQYRAALLSSSKELRTSEIGPEMSEALDHYIELLKSLPVSAPALGPVSSGFGFRQSPFTGGISAHEGVDFSLPIGSHIYSTGDGIVREVRFNPTYGLVVDIEHSPRIITRYAHLKKAFVTEGERVCRGETIALSGASGRATGPHLHYEVLVDGRARNPDKLLSAGRKLAALF